LVALARPRYLLAMSAPASAASGSESASTAHAPPSPPLVVRPARVTYVIFGALSALPFVIALAPRAFGGPVLREPLAIGVLVAFASLVWVRMFRIELTERELRYRSLFGGARRLAYVAIERARIEVGLQRGRDALRPHYRLVVVPRDRAVKPIVVNLKVFPIDELREVCAALDATVDDDEGSVQT
jgi:hypothetical protein